MSFCMKTSSQRKYNKRALMSVKKNCLKKQHNTPYHSYSSCVQPSLGAGNSRSCHHSFPDALNFSRWRPSQISHPGDPWLVMDVKIPKSNSPGLPDPPPPAPIDRCINIIINALSDHRLKYLTSLVDCCNVLVSTSFSE